MHQYYKFVTYQQRILATPDAQPAGSSIAAPSTSVGRLLDRLLG